MTRSILLFILLINFSVMLSQLADLQEEHYQVLTPEEQQLLEEMIRDFEETDPPPGNIRNIAEFEPMQGVLIRYPFGITLELIAELAEDDIVYTLVQDQSQQNTVTSLYNSNDVDLSNCLFIQAETDRYWTRDYGPWFVTYGNEQIGIVDFPYNRPRPHDDEVPIEVGEYLGIEVFGMDLVHTGGNYMTDGLGISASSDLVLSENPALSSSQIDSLMLAYLNITEYHKIPDPNNTYIDHIDCWAKFLAVDKVLIRSVPTYHSQYDEIEAVVDYFEAQTSSYGTPYEIFRVYTPTNQPYTNSLILNRKVYVPITGSSWDDDALAVYESAMPGYEILGIDSPGSPDQWINTDALHCRTKGIADLGMLYIGHIPDPGDITEGSVCELETSIIPYSGEALITDSLKVIYRVNGGNWNYSPLYLQAEFDYSGQIPAQQEGDLVEYYIHAADSSGRRAEHPFTGRYDPHSFVVGPYVSQLEIEPDSIAVQINPDSLKTTWLKITNSGSTVVDYMIEIEALQN